MSTYSWAKKLVELIEADHALAALLVGGKVYGNRADIGAAFPYLTVDSPQYDPRQYFMKAGWRGEEQLSIWTKDPMQARSIFDLLVTLFHNQSFALDSGNALCIRLRLVAIAPDTETTVYHGIVKMSATIL